jgi:hypothetical protein
MEVSRAHSGGINRWKILKGEAAKMTTFASTTITCGACGHNFAHDDLSSTNRFGSMDLDLRPPEMERSTMQAWLQQCPNCGYSAVDASTFDPRHRAVLESPEYRQHLTNSGLPPLAAKFICAGLLAEAAGQLEEAGLSYLRSAWVMDDVMAPVDGRKWRNRACDCLKRAVAAPDISSDARTSLSTILVDSMIIVQSSFRSKTRKLGHLDAQMAVWVTM